jgi:hypothetical protein
VKWGLRVLTTGFDNKREIFKKDIFFLYAGVSGISALTPHFHWVWSCG